MTESKTFAQEQEERQKQHIAARKAAIDSFHSCCRQLREELGYTKPQWDGTDKIKHTSIVTTRGTFLLVDHDWRDRGSSWGGTEYIEGPIRGVKDRLTLKYDSLCLAGVGSISIDESGDQGFEILFMDLIRGLEAELRAALPSSKGPVAQVGNFLTRLVGAS